MPIVLALLLAAKAAHARYQDDDDNKEAPSSSSNTTNNHTTQSNTTNIINTNLNSFTKLLNKRNRPSKTMKKGAYIVHDGRISLPPEERIDSNNNNYNNNNDITENGSNTPLNNGEINTSLETVVVDTDAFNEDTNDTRFTSNNGHDSSVIIEQETTFRNDVRNGWVDAMFGVDFYRDDNNNGNGSSNNNETWRDLSVKQGTGAAGVGTWVTYGALLDPNVDTDNTGVSYGSNGHSNNNTNGKSNNISSTNGNSSNNMKTPRKDPLSTLLKTKSTPLTHSSSISLGGSLLNLRSSSNLDEVHNTKQKQQEQQQKKKIGATISRIPLGLYVKSIEVTSEAYHVGISPGSILIDINGLGLLGETSHRAVERLWRYAGTTNFFFDSSSSSKQQQPQSNTSGTSTTPVRLRFYKHHQIYSVLLLGSHPLRGIEWAPCGNFGLVQRSHGLASQCGVRRGCLVLAVDGIGLRQLDHAGVALELMKRFHNNGGEGGGEESVILTCGYTPASSRSGYYEEKMVEKKGGGAGSSSGVEVRPRPVEYSTALTETFFACTAPSMALVDEGGMEVRRSSDVKRGRDDEQLIASELAAYVAAGGVLPRDLGVVESQLGMFESPHQQRRRVAGNGNVGPCPTIELEFLLDAWDPLVSLTRSMLYQAAGCCEMSFMEMGGPFRIAWGDGDYGKEAAHSISDCIDVISAISEHPKPGVAEQVFDAHLMQLLGVATCALREAEHQNDSNRPSEKLLDILVDVALKDTNLCQRLFFLLRCFIGVLDGQTSEEAATKSLKLLRYAQRRLSGRMFDRSECHETTRHCSEGYPMSRESSSTSSFRKVSQIDIALSESCSSEQRDVKTPGAPANRALRLAHSESGDCLSTDNLSCQTPASTVTANSSDGKKKSKINKSSSKIRQLLKGGKSKSSVKSSTKKNSDNQLPPSASIARTLKQGSTFSFTNVFHKQTASTRTLGELPPHSPIAMSLSMSQKFENFTWILRRLDTTCSEIEKNLVKSFSQKMADLALRPWSASKESALALITQSFRAELRRMNSGSDSGSHFPIPNPVDSSEELTSVDADECFILPSAHFPMLLCFNSSVSPSLSKNARPISSEGGRFNTLYKVTAEILGLRSTMPLNQKAHGSGEAYIVQGAVGGTVQESGASELYINPQRPSRREVISHRWSKGNTLTFETSSNSGHPKTLSLKISTVSHVDTRDDVNLSDYDMGCAFVDLTPIWEQINQTSNHSSATFSSRVFLFDDAAESFDQHGIAERKIDKDEKVEIQTKITVEVVPAEVHPQKRLLLYKHGDDLRQELLAIQFIERCNQILKASGLDLKLTTFRCLPVGAQKGFIEWVSETVPLSQLFRSMCSSGSNIGSRQSSLSKESASLDGSQHSLTATTEVIDSINGQSQSRNWCKYQAIRGFGQRGNVSENPIQDFLRSAAFDEDAPYYIKKDVIDAYVKSCAGYCVITYLLGVGDRHLDNILLHQNGHLLHCDFSFILGHDPKTYLPMRITEGMIRGFGGQESDNYAKFLSFTGAAFLTLRRHSNLHSLLSQVRNMVYANMRDLSLAQPPAEAIVAMRGRFRLDLNDDDALSYIEHVVEKSITSKMWRAVDVMHSLGKHF